MDTASRSAWRGSQYLYDAADDCYYTRAGGRTCPSAISRPGTATAGASRRLRRSAAKQRTADRHRPNSPPPLTPQATPMHLAPGSATDVGGSDERVEDDAGPGDDARVPHARPRRARGSGRRVEVIRRARTVGRAHDADATSASRRLVIRGNDNQSRGAGTARASKPVASRPDAAVAQSTRRRETLRAYAPQTRAVAAAVDAPRIARRPRPRPRRRDRAARDAARASPAASSSSPSATAARSRRSSET